MKILNRARAPRIVRFLVEKHTFFKVFIQKMRRIQPLPRFFYFKPYPTEYSDGVRLEIKK